MHIGAGNTSISRQNRTKTRKTDALCVFLVLVSRENRTKIDPKIGAKQVYFERKNTNERKNTKLYLDAK